jgi:hypothetical protein
MTEPSKRTRQRRVKVWYHDLFDAIPEDYTPLEAVVVIKALADDGNVCMVSKKTRGLAPWEAFGLLAYAMDDYSSATINAATEDD